MISKQKLSQTWGGRHSTIQLHGKVHFKQKCITLISVHSQGIFIDCKLLEQRIVKIFRTLSNFSYFTSNLLDYFSSSSSGSSFSRFLWASYWKYVFQSFPSSGCWYSMDSADCLLNHPVAIGSEASTFHFGEHF